MTRILVTGASGYLGSHVVPELALGGHDVLGVDVREPVMHGSPFERVDLRTTPLEPLVSRRDWILHLAARVDARPHPDVDTVKALWRDNRDLTVRLLKAASAAGTSNFLFASTCGVYAGCDGIADETAPVTISSPYVETKLDAEAAVKAAGSPRFRTLVIRLATLFGGEGVVSNEPLLNGLVRDAVNREEIEVRGPHAWRPLLHVGDAAKAIALLVRRGVEADNGLLNVGDPSLHAQKAELAAAICRRLPRTRVNVEESLDRGYRVRFDQIRRLTGFRSKRTIAQGIDELVNHYAKTIQEKA